MGRTHVISTPSAVALSAATAKSLLLIVPTVDFVITELAVSFDASATATGALVELYRTTTIGSPAGTSVTPVRGSMPTAAVAAATAIAALTAEPSAIEIIRTWYVQPFGGLVMVQFPLGREPRGVGGSGNRIGLRVTTATGSTPNARAYIEIEE